MRGRRAVDPDEVTIARERTRFSDDANALREATQAFHARERELLDWIAQIEKENRQMRTDLSLAGLSRTHTLPERCYKSEPADPKAPLNLPRMASRNAKRKRAGSAPPPQRRSGAPPKVQGRSRESS